MQSVKIVMDEEKMLKNGLNPSEIYAKIDELANEHGLHKQDKFHYVGNDDERDFAKIGVFTHISLLHYQDFTKNVKEWLWLDDGEIDSELIGHYKSQNMGVWQ